MEQSIHPTRFIRGSLEVPGDKSISHRALIIAAMAEGTTQIKGLLKSSDVHSTRDCLRALGVRIDDGKDFALVHGRGVRGFRQPEGPLDCGNSGTTIRLLMGLLAGQSFSTTLIGDASLSRRPMARVAEPLIKMGAQIELKDGKSAPVVIEGAPLRGISYSLPVASAQVKSAILLAALCAEGATAISGLIRSRDHTEKFLVHFGAKLEISETDIYVKEGQVLMPAPVSVPGDPSSAAFWIAAAAILPGSEVEMSRVLLNPSRLGFIRVLKRMGADIHIDVESKNPEPLGTIRIRYTPLRGTDVSRAEVPSLIDEIPLIGILATQAEGTTTVRGAEELRVKETDRLEVLSKNLEAMGAAIRFFSDGFSIAGSQKLRGASIDSFEDHRIAMAFSIAGLVAKGETLIRDSQCVNVSYPEFYADLARLRND